MKHQMYASSDKVAPKMNGFLNFKPFLNSLYILAVLLLVSIFAFDIYKNRQEAEFLRTESLNLFNNNSGLLKEKIFNLESSLAELQLKINNFNSELSSQPELLNVHDELPNGHEKFNEHGVNKNNNNGFKE